MPLTRRTLLAGAIAAICRPALGPPAPPILLPGWVTINPAMWNGLGDPVLIGRFESFRFIESPLRRA